MVDVTIVVDSVRAFFKNSGTRASFENLFSKSARKESPGTVLADCCSSMGFPLIKSPSVSERVCRSCGRKIRNASELYGFIQTAVTCSNDSATGNKTEESDLQECSTVCDSSTTTAEMFRCNFDLESIHCSEGLLFDFFGGCKHNFEVTSANVIVR